MKLVSLIAKMNFKLIESGVQVSVSTASYLLLAQWALIRALSDPFSDAVPVEDVTVMAPELEHLIIIFEVLKTDRASMVDIESKTRVRNRLHLI